jgi:S-adenosylhomocysteine hydrolase
MTVKIARDASYTGNANDGIGANSADTTGGRFFVSKTNEVVSKAGTTGEVAGVSHTQKVFASDNETVAKARIEFIPANVDITYDVTITNGTITVVDEGKYYNLTAAGDTVDGTTESTTTGQLRMVKFNSATNSTFRIANK